MATATEILKIAAKEVGTVESPANSNKQKYGKAFGINGVPWCAEFLWWCFNKAKASKLFPKNANAAYAQDEIVSKCGGKWIMKKNTSAATRKAYLKNAKPGDVVTFDFGAMNAYRQHIGIVKSVSGNYLICIEGNTSKAGSQSNGGMVCEQRRIYTSICAAVRPAYDGEIAQVKTETKKAEAREKFTVGKTYIVNTKSDPLNIRKGAGTNTAILGKIPKGKKVTCLEVRNGWLKVKYGNVTGFISGEYVKEA